MNTVDFAWQGQILHLLLNGAALFDIFDRYGQTVEIPVLIAGSDRKSLEATCWVLWKLAEQGELARRYMGHDRERPPTVEKLLALMTPLEVPQARLAITRTVRLGFSMSHKEPEEYVDLGLQELQKKTGLRRIASNIFRRLHNFFTSLPRLLRC